ncbi:hypothetical protein KFL_002820080 [Klebsormidium nitens]|uniref:Uncharacterized protein n=1 Tax=Klebsormidium nitens TaxID=105231 RepID=A0A1Y1I714_KLENI|nr:hypothetical protein KFL_002820080 [Klebsormidium nitens]|eukprot:GAQ86313.1 hypothetical protein KFL_002820080 [Klebsormidium nitens]
MGHLVLTCALLELVLRCQSALALSFDHCVRLYRKLLARLEVRPTGFCAGKDSAPGHGTLQMELATFLMHRGEVERAYDAVKPLLLSSLHKHVPIYHVYVGLLQHALWLNSVEADARRVQSDAQSAAGASVRTHEHLRLAASHFETAESLEPDSPLIFNLRRQLEAAAAELGPAAGRAPGVVERLSREVMIQKLTSLCEKTHDVECYESLLLLLEAEDPVDPAALERCYLELLQVDPGAEAGLTGLRTLYEKGDVSVTVFMAALAKFLEAEPRDTTAWGDLLGCIERWWVAAKDSANSPPITLGITADSARVHSTRGRSLGGPEVGSLRRSDDVARDFADVWLWRLDSWREQQFGRDVLRHDWDLFLRTTDNETRGGGGRMGVAEKERGSGGVERGLIEGGDRENELATWLRTKAAVSAYLYGPPNEYAQSVLRLFRCEGGKGFDGEKFARELEARFGEAEAYVKVLRRERKRRDERFWEGAREREAAVRGKEKHKKDLLASLVKSTEASGLQGGLVTGRELIQSTSGKGLQSMEANEGPELEAGSGAKPGVRRGFRGMLLQHTQAAPSGIADRSLSKGLVIAEVPAMTDVKSVSAPPLTGAAAGLGGISEWLRSMYPRGEVAKSLAETETVEPSVSGLTAGPSGTGKSVSVAADQTTAVVAVEEKDSGNLREEDESVFGVLEIADEWLAEVEEERVTSRTTGRQRGDTTRTGIGGQWGGGRESSGESESSDESGEESDEEDDDVSGKAPRKRGRKNVSGGNRSGGETKSSGRGGAVSSLDSGEESGEGSDDVSNGESGGVSSGESSGESEDVRRPGRKESSSDESDDVSSGESGDVSDDDQEAAKGKRVERLTVRQQALKRKREERELGTG